MGVYIIYIYFLKSVLEVLLSNCGTGKQGGLSGLIIVRISNKLCMCLYVKHTHVSNLAINKENTK